MQVHEIGRKALNGLIKSGKVDDWSNGTGDYAIVCCMAKFGDSPAVIDLQDYCETEYWACRSAKNRQDISLANIAVGGADWCHYYEVWHIVDDESDSLQVKRFIVTAWEHNQPIVSAYCGMYDSFDDALQTFELVKQISSIEEVRLYNDGDLEMSYDSRMEDTLEIAAVHDAPVMRNGKPVNQHAFVKFKDDSEVLESLRQLREAAVM